MSDNVRLPSLSTFPRLLMHHAQVRPNHPATREKDMGIWQTWTWLQVAEEVRAMASGLAELGFKRGDNLATFAVNRQTGALQFTGQYTSVGNPSIVVFVDLAKAA